MTGRSPTDDIGYKKPPRAGRFPKGRSGNPRGRPKGRYKQPPYEAVLGQTVTIREDGVERQVTAAEAFLLYLTKQGLEGDGPAGRAAMHAIEEARASRTELTADDLTSIRIVFTRPGRVNGALEPLRMARKLYRTDEAKCRMALEPWIVEMALARLGDRRLTIEEQEVVVKATRTPRKVRWPDWWEVKP